MKRIFSILFFLGIAILFYSCDSDTRHEYTMSGKTMGTLYSVRVIFPEPDAEKVSELKTAIDSVLKVVNKQMSTYDPESEISKFNAFRDTIPFKVSQEFATVVKEAIVVHQKSGGAFDVTIGTIISLWGFGNKGSREAPPADSEIAEVLATLGTHLISVPDSVHLQKSTPGIEINLGAIAKGYGVDAVGKLIQSGGYENYLVEIGGEIVAHGMNRKQHPWKIGIDKPEFDTAPGKELQSTVCLNNHGIATSGDYRNYFEADGKHYSHIINPVTGKPVSHNLASVTVIAENCMIADALSTAVLVLGTEKGIEFLENWNGAEGMLITRENPETFSVHHTSGFTKFHCN